MNCKPKTMLTNPQRARLDSLKKGELTPQEKADLYYRVSKNIKKTLTHSIKDTVELLDELPESYLSKIDFYEAAINALNLIENLICRLEPAPRAGDRVIRNFRVQVDNPLPGVALCEGEPSIAHVTVTYKPNDSEIKLLNKLTRVKEHIEGSLELNKNNITNYTEEEFKNKVMKKLESKQNLEVRMRSIIVEKPSPPQ